MGRGGGCCRPRGIARKYRFEPRNVEECGAMCLETAWCRSFEWSNKCELNPIPVNRTNGDSQCQCYSESVQPGARTAPDHGPIGIDVDDADAVSPIAATVVVLAVVIVIASAGVV